MFALLHGIVVHTASLLPSVPVYGCDTIHPIGHGRELFLVFSRYDKANIFIQVFLSTDVFVFSQGITRS